MNINNYKMRTKMRHKKLKLSAVFLTGVALTGLQAQMMYVKERIGTQTAYTLSNIQKMSFSSGNLAVTKTDNSRNFYALSDLRYLNFSDIKTDLQENLSVQNQMLSVYPNPVSDKLNIDLTGIGQRNGTLSILNFEGKILVSQQISNEGVLSLDFSHLPIGIYFCRYNNATELKTEKIIKQ
jgi:hypothetical protein